MSYKGGLNVTSETGSGFERLRVDTAQTSFFEGREFRTFYEFSIVQATSYVIKAVVPVDIILHNLGLSLDAGHIRLHTKVGGTEGGTFDTAMPIFNTNNMTYEKDRRKSKSGAYYMPQTTLHGGGTHTDGVTLDIIRQKTSDNSNFSSTVGASPSDERGVGPNTYYFVLENIGASTATGVFRARWEERGNGFFST